MTTIADLFLLAVHGESKAERHNAFRQLSEIATRATGPESEEARYALAHSAEYEKQLQREAA